MSYQVLARKWRPRTFNELVGQEHVLKALVNALDHDRLHHAFLFTGTRGVGKTTIARILAKSLNCEEGVSSQPCGVCSACTEINEGRFIDLIEVDAASRTKVEETRELLDNVQYAPSRGRYKVYLIDEVHMFSNHSFNALLKTLEEPPPHVKFLLATTDPQKLPVTILSRCLQFNLKRLPQEQIRGYLEKVLGEEGINFDTGSLALIARAADGSMRDALSLLDQAIAYGSGVLAETDVRAMLGSIEQDHIIDLLTLLANNDAPGLLTRIGQLAERTPDFSGVLAELISTLHRIALAQTTPDAIDDSLGDRKAILSLAGLLSPEDVQLYYQTGLIGRRDLPLAPDSRGGFEMVLLRMLAFRPGDIQQPSPSSVPRAAQQSSPVTSSTAAQAVAEPVPPSPATAQANAQTNTNSDFTPAATSPPAGDSEWETIVNALNLTGMNRQLAINCTLTQRSDDQIQLSISPSQQHLLGKSREATLTKALSDYLGLSVKLTIKLEQAVAGTPADLQQARDDQRLQSAQSAIESDDAVQAFKETFGAQVHANSVRPIENRTDD